MYQFVPSSLLSATLEPSCTSWYALTLWCTKMHWTVLQSLSTLWRNAIFHRFRLKKWTAIPIVILPVFYQCTNALCWWNRDGLCFLMPDAQDWIALDKTLEWVGVPFESCCCCCVIKPHGHHFRLPGYNCDFEVPPICVNKFDILKLQFEITVCGKI